MKISTKKPATMTAKQINDELDMLDEGNSEVNDELIAVGRGDERADVTRHKAKTDPTDRLAIEWNAISDRRAQLRLEIYARAGSPDHTPSRLPLRGYGPREGKDRA